MCYWANFYGIRFLEGCWFLCKGAALRGCQFFGSSVLCFLAMFLTVCLFRSCHRSFSCCWMTFSLVCGLYTFCFWILLFFPFYGYRHFLCSLVWLWLELENCTLFIKNEIEKKKQNLSFVCILFSSISFGIALDMIPWKSQPYSQLKIQIIT